LYLFLLSLRSHLYFTHFPSFPTRRSSDLFGFFGAQDSFSPDDYSGSFCVYPGHPALPSVIFLVRGRPLFLRLFRPPNGGRRCGVSSLIAPAVPGGRCSCRRNLVHPCALLPSWFESCYHLPPPLVLRRWDLKTFSGTSAPATPSTCSRCCL